MVTRLRDKLQSMDTLGIAILAVYVVGFASILLAMLGERNLDALWAIILVSWGAMRVREGSVLSPLVHAAHYGVGYLLTGIASALVGDTGGLWAMILVNWVVNYHVTELGRSRR